MDYLKVVSISLVHAVSSLVFLYFVAFPLFMVLLASFPFSCALEILLIKDPQNLNEVPYKAYQILRIRLIHNLISTLGEIYSLEHSPIWFLFSFKNQMETPLPSSIPFD
jgi:hypothetical protein